MRHLGLPIEIKTGFIGKVQLQVPVRQIRSAPWLIAIENLFVVVSPVDLDKVNYYMLLLTTVQSLHKTLLYITRTKTPLY